MGPKILSRVSAKSGIVYSWRLFPIGGFVSMVGEDEDSEDENAFCRKPVWQRMIITAAGATVNLVAGILVMAVLVAFSSGLASTVVYDFIPESDFDNAYGELSDDEYSYYSSENAGLCAGDRIIKVGKSSVHIGDEVNYEIVHQGYRPIDITVIRDGERMVIENVDFTKIKDQGVTFGIRDFRMYTEPKKPVTVLKHGFFKSVSTVKMIWESLGDLISGRYGVKAVSGPVAFTQMLADAASRSVYQFVYLAVVISMNLGIMNLLPLPALDGGRLAFQFIELIRRKPVNRNVEGYIHFAGIVILMILMVLIAFKDVISLF